MKKTRSGLRARNQGGFGGKRLTQVVLAGKNISGDTGESENFCGAERRQRQGGRLYWGIWLPGGST